MYEKINLIRSGMPKAVLIAASFAIFAVWPLHAQDGNTDEPLPRFEPSACPLEVPAAAGEVQCGYLIVPENRSNPSGATIRLAVLILKSTVATPAPDPVIYLEGGPGGSALDALESTWAYTPFRFERDFILIDQRGTGFSIPSLDCPEYDDLSRDLFNDLLPEDDVIDRQADVLAACRERLASEGIDLQAYNSAESAADIADLRIALGYEAVNLYGISYGTRLALTVMRDHPEGIRSVILDSTVAIPANQYEEGTRHTDRVFTSFFEECASDAVCSTSFTDLEEKFYDLVARADERPIYVWAKNPYKRSLFRERVPLDGQALIGTVFIALYSSDIIRSLPLVIDEASRGNYRLLATYYELNARLQAESSFSIGMYYSLQCQEELPFNNLSEAETVAASFPRLGDWIINEADFTLCPIWDVDPAPELEAEPVASDIPTLVLAGELDPITPPEWGELSAESLTNSTLVILPRLGHGSTLSTCPQSIALDFIRDPAASLQTGCTSSIRDEQPFITDIASAPGLYALVEQVLVEPTAGLFVTAGVFLLCFGLTVTVWPIWRVINWWIHRQEQTSVWHYLAGWGSVLVAGWNIIFVVALVGSVFVTLTEDYVYVLYGLPTWGLPILLMPYLSAIGVLGLLALSFPIWFGQRWGVVAKLFHTGIVITMVAFGLWVLYVRAFWLPI